MDKAAAIDIVSKYKAEITKQLGPVQVVMYGSYSKGTARNDSDIDVAVILPYQVDNWLGTVKVLWKASRKVNSLIEPVLLDAKEQSPLNDEIRKWGIAIN